MLYHPFPYVFLHQIALRHCWAGVTGDGIQQSYSVKKRVGRNQTINVAQVRLLTGVGRHLQRIMKAGNGREHVGLFEDLSFLLKLVEPVVPQRSPPSVAEDEKVFFVGKVF